MRKLNLAVALLLSLLLTFGCSNNSKVKKTQTEEVNQVNFELIASEKSLPSHMHELAFQRKEAPGYTYWVKKVSNQYDFEVAWKTYELEEMMEDVDFDKKNVFFIGVQESGSCPYTEENIELNTDNEALQVLLTEHDGECTSDATPRTFVIQGDKDISKDIKKVVITQSGTKTEIPIKK